MNVSENRGFPPKSSICSKGLEPLFSPSILGAVFPLFLVQHPYTHSINLSITPEHRPKPNFGHPTINSSGRLRGYFTWTGTGTLPHDGSMGLIYLPIHESLIFYGFHVGKYTSSSHGWYGFQNKGTISVPSTMLTSNFRAYLGPLVTGSLRLGSKLTYTP